MQLRRKYESVISHSKNLIFCFHSFSCQQILKILQFIFNASCTPLISLIMPMSIQIFLSSLHKFKKKFLHQLKVKSWNRRKTMRVPSHWSNITSSFAAVEVSDQLQRVFMFFDTNSDGKNISA